ncbi:MAG: hypothetical protein QNJ91_12240 [Gammaproteobacteria bacterium]|nr:hypothetical protein [Gammaproteobacteria bacterium]
MPYRFLTALLLAGLLALLAACTEQPEPPAAGLLRHVPADTPYVFVTSKHMPDGLRERLGDHYAAQLAGQRATFARVREQLADSPDGDAFVADTKRLFDVIDAFFAETEGRDSVAALRELGIEPVTRSVFYGIGVLPAMRVEIADAAKLRALLDRVEQRAGVSAARAQLDGIDYRRIDLGAVDAVITVSDGHLVAGLLADSLFERDLPLLLGRRDPARTLADSGDIDQLIERHGFTGYGEGFIRLDELVATLLGEGASTNREVMQALGVRDLPISAACLGFTRGLVAGMPRMVMGIRTADDHQLAARGVWESSPGVSAYLQKLAAPVPGVGAANQGLLAIGMGLDLPQLRNAIEALLRQVGNTGAGCEWVDPEALQAVMPQLNLALGPMTAGIKGFNLQIDDLVIDPQTLQPVDVRAGLLAAVDDPRGVFALGAMFNPALASFEVPQDGSFVELPRDLGIDAAAPPVKVAIKDRALLLMAGAASADFASRLSNAVTVTPSPLLAVDYGVYQLVERFGGIMERAVQQLGEQGETDMAADLRDQLDNFRLQAQFFERLRVSVFANEQGLVMDQVMELR